MQTFLPYNDFELSAACLDNRRLGKQRLEAVTILNTISGRSQAWAHHPAALMWVGYADALSAYYNACVREWIRRGFRNSMQELAVEEGFDFPPWFGSAPFHDSHRSNLLRKDFGFYSKRGWDTPSGLPYVWPLRWMDGKAVTTARYDT